MSAAPTEPAESLPSPTIQRMASPSEARAAGHDLAALTCPKCGYSLASLAVLGGKVHCPECGNFTVVVDLNDSRARPLPRPSLLGFIRRVAWPTLAATVSAVVAIAIMALGSPLAQLGGLFLVGAFILQFIGLAIWPFIVADRIARAHDYAARYRRVYWLTVLQAILLNLIPPLVLIVVLAIRFL